MEGHMIESIYSKEQSGVGESEVHTLFRFPKNVRQIGMVKASKKIYVEDYVMTYMKQVAEKGIGEYEFAVLLGKFVRLEDSRNIFISGAVTANEIHIEEDTVFSNETWTNIYSDIKRYFTDVEIVGWFIAKSNVGTNPDERLKKMHLDNFGGQDKVLLMYDSAEAEGSFYVYGDGELKKQEGYYIYYEKNEEMQTYMIEHKEIESEESHCEERVIKEIRNVISTKKKEPQERKIVTLVYGAGAVLAAAVLIIAVTLVNNYGKIDKLEKKLISISENIDQEEDKTPQRTVDFKEDKEVTQVETMTGNLTTIKQEEIVGEKSTKPKPKKKEKEAITYYIVKKGDTLVSISIDVYDSANYVSKIQKANGIENKDVIFVGQRLIIP